MGFTDVFGSGTVPTAESSYIFANLTADTSAYWPDNYSGSGLILSSITELTSTSAVVVTMPSAMEVSIGKDILIRNDGSYTLTFNDNAGTLIGTITSGQSKLFYVTDNTTAAGVWGQLTYGVGSSSVDAATLIGYGIKAITTTLNQSHSVYSTADSYTVLISDRAKLLLATSGSVTFTLPSVSSAGDDFFVMVRNGGSGTLTIDPYSTELIDGFSTITINPSESTIICCSGTAWFTVGLGRAVEFAFTQLTKDVSAGGTITLSAAEAANKLLTFTGSPAANLTVVVPNTVQVYYTYSAISTAKSITLKTAAGSGVVLSQNDRVICFCDSVNVISAQSASASTSLSLINGSAANPSLYFASATGTGVYLYNTTGFGISVAGALSAGFDANGIHCSRIESTVVTGTAPLTVASTTKVTNLNADKLDDHEGSYYLSPANLSSVVPVTKGGTGVATLTGIVKASGTSNFSAASAGTDYVAPGGALGTPSSGTLTNCTGLPTAGLLNDAVTYAKIQNVSATDKILGRATAGSGDIEELTCTAAGRALLDDATAADQIATLGAMINGTAAKTAAYTVVAGDRGKLIDATTGTWTLSLTAAATLGDGFAFAVRNSGTGVITLDPAGTETIDGATTITLAAGESCLVVCDGAAFKTVGKGGGGSAVDVQTFTSSGNWTKPAKGSIAIIEVWGGGGSGGKGTIDGVSPGGGGGAYATKTVLLSSLGSTETVTIGAGGASKTTSGVGNNGGNTTFGSVLTGYGGGGGGTSTVAPTSPGGGGGGGYGAGAAALGGAGCGAGMDVAGGTKALQSGIYAGGGGAGINSASSDPVINGGTSVYGGGGGGGASTSVNGTGGSSLFGGAGGAGSSSANGTAGTQPGGGGGGSDPSGNSGAGADGKCVVTVL